MAPRTEPMSRGNGFQRKPGAPRPARAVAERRPKASFGEFSDATKLLCRTRAGNGDVKHALCEACGIWLGEEGGQIQHIVARGSGGRGPKAPWWIASVVNAALLCGTPFTLCHGRCERREAEMGPDGMGFWLKDAHDPSKESFMLHGRDGGATFYRTVDGGYSTAPPAVAGDAA
jgi:hypothetical protein